MSLNPFVHTAGTTCAASISSYRSFTKGNAHLNNLTSYHRRRTNTYRCRRPLCTRASKRFEKSFSSLDLPLLHLSYRSFFTERERDTSFDVTLHVAYHPLAIPWPLTSPSSHSRRRLTDTDEMRIDDNRFRPWKTIETARLSMRLGNAVLAFL